MTLERLRMSFCQEVCFDVSNWSEDSIFDKLSVDELLVTSGIDFPLKPFLPFAGRRLTILRHPILDRFPTDNRWQADISATNG